MQLQRLIIADKLIKDIGSAFKNKPKNKKILFYLSRFACSGEFRKGYHENNICIFSKLSM